MVSKMKKIHLTLLSLIFLTACSDNKMSLSCGDTEISDLVLEISTEELKNQLFRVFLYQRLGRFSGFSNTMSYAEYLSTEDNKMKTLIVKQTEETVSNVNLTAIRLQEKNTTTGMVSCAAALSVNGGENANITYTAQMTNEDELYVEVSGL